MGRMSKYWNKLSWEVVEALFFPIHKSCLNMLLENTSYKQELLEGTHVNLSACLHRQLKKASQFLLSLKCT